MCNDEGNLNDEEAEGDTDESGFAGVNGFKGLDGLLRGWQKVIFGIASGLAGDGAFDSVGEG